MCGCLLARAVLASAESRGCLLVAGSPKLADPEEMIFELTSKLPKYEITVPLDLKQSAYERRNPNRPFYDRFRKRRKSK